MGKDKIMDNNKITSARVDYIRLDDDTWALKIVEPVTWNRTTQITTDNNVRTTILGFSQSEATHIMRSIRKQIREQQK